MNYNAYGARIQDLHFAPDALFQRLRPYQDPLEFATVAPAFRFLRDGYAEDMARDTGLEAGVRGGWLRAAAFQAS